jgi:hypothetical protein
MSFVDRLECRLRLRLHRLLSLPLRLSAAAAPSSTSAAICCVTRPIGLTASPT